MEMTTISVWFFSDIEPSKYPMVSIEKDGRRRYYYGVSPSNLKRLSKVANKPSSGYRYLGYDGWTIDIPTKQNQEASQ